MKVRSLLLFAVASFAVIASPAKADDRKSITALTPAELQSLRNGFQQMIDWNNAPRSSPQFRRSLLFWANMHSYFGQNCAGISGLQNQGMSGIAAQTPTTPEEFATWCSCHHGDIHFLTWHRMYLYFFEQVLRAAANDPKLTLPYWDYETNGAIPEAFRSPTYTNASGQTVTNPLYVANRQGLLNAGTGSLTAAVTSTSAAMALNSYPDFNSSLEQTPHGAVHCATGVAGCPTGYMGSVPAAANDPIFYTHHANLDRLYDCWLAVSPNARAPAIALRNRSFTFIDGQGSQVSRTVGSMMTTQQLGYSYASGGGCPLRVRVPPIVRNRVLWFKFVPPGPLKTDTPVALPEAQVARSSRAKAVQLVLENPQVEDSPTGLVEIALEGANGQRVPLGLVSAFNQSAPGHHRDMGAERSELRFEVGDALKNVGSGAHVTVRPAAGVEPIDKNLLTAELDLRGKPVSLRTNSIRLETR